MLFLALCTTSMAYAQKDTVLVAGFFESGQTEGTLNAAIEAAKASGNINNTVFKLKPYEVYVLSGSIFMDVGQNLEIVADKPGNDQESAPPQIVWTNEEIDRAYIIQTYGNLTMKNVWVRGATLAGTQLGTSITFEDVLDANDTERGEFDGRYDDRIIAHIKPVTGSTRYGIFESVVKIREIPSLNNHSRIGLPPSWKGRQNPQLIGKEKVNVELPRRSACIRTAVDSISAHHACRTNPAR